MGFDVEMAHILAEDLNAVQVEFVPFEFERLGTTCSTPGRWTLPCPVSPALPDRFLLASFSREPYLDLRLAFIVLGPRAGRLQLDLEQLQKRESLTIALVSTHYYRP